MTQKKHFYSGATLIAFILIFWASAVQKDLLITDGSRSDGTLTLSYEYGAFQKPEVNWEKAKYKAIEKCKSWGYAGAEFFEAGTRYCLSYDGYGNCNRWRVVYKCQCTTDPQPSYSDANKSKPLNSGTGFAISSKGHIVTNYHVVQEANSIVIKGLNGDFLKSYDAKIQLKDKNNDLAILKINDPTFSHIDTIPFIITEDLADVGSSIFCLGFPLRATMGDEIKITNGIISAKSGYEGDITTYQTTIAVQTGNSGAPVFNKKGELIGIINAKHIGAENASYATKTMYLHNLIDLLPEQIKLQAYSPLTEIPMTKQIEILKKYTYIVEVK